MLHAGSGDERCSEQRSPYPEAHQGQSPSPLTSQVQALMLPRPTDEQPCGEEELPAADVPAVGLEGETADRLSDDVDGHRDQRDQPATASTKEGDCDDAPREEAHVSCPPRATT